MRRKKRVRALRRLVPLALLLCAFLAAPSMAEPPRTSYAVAGGVGAITMGPDGTLWFVTGSQMGWIKPDGTLETFEKDLEGHSWDLAMEADGNLWGAGWGSIARRTPAGEVTRFPLPKELGEPSAIAAAPGGGVWFVSWRGDKRILGRQGFTGPAYVGRLAADGRVESSPLPGEAGARTTAPAGIALGPDGSLWIADRALAKIHRVSPDGQIASFELPSAPASLTVGPGGAIWYIAGRLIGRLSPGGEVTEFPLPVGGGTKIVAGPDGNLWFGGGWQVGRMTPWGQVTSYVVGSGNVSDLVAGRDGSVWVGTTGNPVKWVPGSISKLPTGQPGVELVSTEAVVRGGRFALVLECGGSPTRGCAGKVEYGWGGKAPLGSYSIPPESRRKVQLRLPAAAQRQLVRLRFWRERFIVTVKGGERAVREGVVLRVPRPLRREAPPGRMMGIPLPEDVEVGALARDPSGDFWFADPRGDRIFRMTPGVKFRSYRLPMPPRYPKAVTAGPLRSIWFLTERTREGRRSPGLGRLSASGEFSEITFPGETPGQYLLAGPDGNLWVVRSGLRKGEIDRVTPRGKVTRFPVREADSIVRGPGGLWFTASALTIGRLTLGGEIARFQVPGRGYVKDIAAGPDGNVWFTHVGRKGGPTVGRVTPRGKIVEFPTYREGRRGSVPGSIVAGPHGNLWFAEYWPPAIGRVTPRGRITHFWLPKETAEPTGLLVGPGGDLWFSLRTDNEVGVFGLPGRGGTCPARSAPENC